MRIEGRVAVVTGGGSGIGAGCAALLRAKGATVVTWGQGTDEVDVTCDVSDESDVAEAMRRTRELAGTPTVLVAAAGVSGTSAPLPDQAIDVWERVVAVNVRGAFLTMREIARGMIAESLDGSLVTISSTGGIYTIPTSASYTTSKAAVSQLCRVAAIDLGAFGIRVNAVCPGPTATPMLGYLTEDEAYVAEVAAVTPLGRIGTPELLADSVVNVLASDWITGTVIAVDGGESLVTARGRWTMPRAGEESLA
jgi:NAD(P)-dependent dehydrogenase (short-subunit alcohol dehydrogenase family)